MNVAGLFFSIKKCPTHANPYPDKSAYKINKALSDKKNFIKISKNNLAISFVTKKKIGCAVKRNRIRRRLKGITIKILNQT